MSIATSIGAVVAALLLALPRGMDGAALAQPAGVHDAMVLAVKPLRVTIPVAAPGVAKGARVKVLNADAEGTQTIRLEAASVDCPGITILGPPDFRGEAASTPDTVSLAPGRKATARLRLEIAAQAFEPSSSADPHRCALKLRASTVAPAGAIDPSPRNNVTTLEVDVVRAGGTPPVDGGWTVRSVKAVTLKPNPVAAGATARVTVNVANLAPAGAATLVLTTSDGDCVPGTVGTADFDARLPGAQVDRVVGPRRTATATLPVTVDLRMLAFGGPNAPARCTALIRVHGAGGGDRDASNDVTRLVIGVAGTLDPGGPAAGIEIAAPPDRSQAAADGVVPVVVRLSPTVQPRPAVVLWTGTPPHAVGLTQRFTVEDGTAAGVVYPFDLEPGLSVLQVSVPLVGSARTRSAFAMFSWEPAIDVSLADRCELLGQSSCLLPFPSDHFTTLDSRTDTGRRVHFARASLPANVAGVHVDPTEWNRNDGFSPATPILAHVPGIDLARSQAAPITDMGRSLDAEAPIVLLDATAGQRHPFFAELDANATSDAGRALIIRPVRNLVEGHRYVVAFRRLQDASGAVIPASRAFAVHRDGVATFLPAFEARRAQIEGVLLELAAAGIGRSDLQLAWDFTVASQRSLSERLLHIRDEAFAALGDAVPPFVVTSVENDADAYIYRRIRGTFEVPLYLAGTGAPGSTFNYPAEAGPDALPVRNGTFAADFACWVPRSATADGNDPVVPGRAMLDGHGLFQDIPEYFTRPRPLANEHDLVQCMSTWIGQASEDIPQVQAALGEASLGQTIYDRAQQGILNYLFLGRLMKDPRGFASHPAFRAGASDTPVLIPGELYFLGGSQAAALGGVATAMASDWTRAVLTVPPMNFSLLETRSVHWATYGPYRDAAYSDQLERSLLFAITQMLQDRSEPSGYAAHIVADPYRNTPPHAVLLIEAFGDRQVANIATENEARTLGVHVWRPFLADGRSPDLTPAWDLPAIPALPFRGSALVMWDFGGPPPPTENVWPTGPGADPHGGAGGSDPRPRQMMSDFLHPEGAVLDACGGPCESYLDP